jgi:hypothetical protein
LIRPSRGFQPLPDEVKRVIPLALQVVEHSTQLRLQDTTTMKLDRSNGRRPSCASQAGARATLHPGGDSKWRQIFAHPLLALVLMAISCWATAAQEEFVSHWSPKNGGIAYGFLAGLTRTGGSQGILQDFTVAAQLTARNDAGVHQWAFGVAAEAWAMPGSRSVLVGVEAAVINQEPTNHYFKIASNAVMKNRPDGAPDVGQPMNANTIAYWVTAQSGTGFERGLVFGRDSLLATASRPVAIDLSDLPDAEIAKVDLIRIRKNVSLRYDPVRQELVLVIDGK